jgi:hypothetical protein
LDTCSVSSGRVYLPVIHRAPAFGSHAATTTRMLDEHGRSEDLRSGFGRYRKFTCTNLGGQQRQPRNRRHEGLCQWQDCSEQFQRRVECESHSSEEHLPAGGQRMGHGWSDLPEERKVYRALKRVAEKTMEQPYDDKAALRGAAGFALPSEVIFITINTLSSTFMLAVE